MSFLQQLKVRKARGVCDRDSRLMPETEKVAAEKITQLHLDVYQTEQTIIIYAQLAGVNMSDVQISIEGDTDIILIQGRRIRPEYIAFPKKVAHGSFVAEECVWGGFYRRIILPKSVNIQKAEAKIKNGVLILVLPLIQPSEKEKNHLKVMGSRIAHKED